MRRSDFAYDLPAELVAQYPAAEREGARLLRLSRGSSEVADCLFTDLPSLLRPGDLLVFNDTRVIPARFHARKPTGGHAEILLERILDDRRILAQVRGGKFIRINARLAVEGGGALIVQDRHADMHVLAAEGDDDVADLLDRAGHVPLPPYIRRGDEPLDRERYQTVFAKRPGAVAAPTAGLHFTERLLEEVRRNGIETGFVTLHVGAGTFQPIRCEEVKDHVMHTEWFDVPESVCVQVAAARQRRGRVIAVGTTSVRCLESAAAGGELKAARGETRLFIYPGFAFRVVDALLTNFHLPESTLLMLVCAFAGTANALSAYRHAVAQRYRFFSYGDAMFIH